MTRPKPTHLDKSDLLREKLGPQWIPNIYLELVRSGRSRSYKIDVPAREHFPEIQYTLLGIELKVGKRRIACPDLATARYLRVFARIGVSDVAVPYDITRISAIADELETAWHTTMLLLSDASREFSIAATARVRNLCIVRMRSEIAEAGAGPAMPEFDRPTRRTDR